MDQATHNKNFNRSVCKRKPLRTLAELTALVSDRLVRGNLPVVHASSSEQIVVTVSQELAASLDATFKGHALSRMAHLFGWMPSAIGHLQGGCAANSGQIIVTVSRALKLRQSRELNCAEVIRMADEREAGLAAGQA